MFFRSFSVLPNVTAPPSASRLADKLLLDSAFKVLSEHGIFVEYGMLTDYIVNRKGNGVCPFEQAVMGVQAPEDAYAVIIKKMNEMSLLNK